ncbi:dual OB domain-containing protein [Pseudanabaena sp. ABRG5-3]|uniref:dual OB domain-containing protein n=1 Tax=Pseudanabaena sp. ABRG5-3 TaxID=685565 RepID=UPI000DC700EE|nr:hypothetical protein [Pseudanabaena sp. ABRG5-3]BBC26280.1 hypothetical protein ABRG53_4023 [Pseudanabaena sp. ABRG5-3]
MSSIKRIVCLANSWKLKERCIAGIDIDTGKWIRPVCDSLYPDDGRVPRSVYILNGNEPKLLDILEIPLAATGSNFDFESENLSIMKGQWKVIGKAKAQDITKYCDDDLILHNNSKFVSLEFLQSLPSDKRKTLQLVKVSRLSVKSRQTSKDITQWLGTIVTSSGKKLSDIPITDPSFIKKLEYGLQTNGQYLITMSLGMPYKPVDWEINETPCWKLIAGVIDLVDNQIISIEDLIHQSDVEMKRVGWTKLQGRDYLVHNFNKRSRQLLTHEELRQFLDHLQSLPNDQQNS